MPFSDEEFGNLEGELFSQDVVNRYFNRPLSRSEALVHPGWLAAARGDGALLRDYTALVFAGKTEFYRAMDFYVAHPPVRGAEGRLWSVGRLDNYVSKSSAWQLRLGLSSGRLVGEAPEAPRAATLEQIVR